MLRGCQLVWQRRRMRELSAIVGSRRRGWATLGLRTHLIASTSAPLPVAHNVSQLISENTERQELFRIEMGGRRAGMRRTPSSAVVGIGSDGDAFELNVTMHKLSRSPRSFGRVFGLPNQTPPDRHCPLRQDGLTQESLLEGGMVRDACGKLQPSGCARAHSVPFGKAAALARVDGRAGNPVPANKERRTAANLDTADASAPWQDVSGYQHATAAPWQDVSGCQHLRHGKRDGAECMVARHAKYLLQT